MNKTAQRAGMILRAIFNTLRGLPNFIGLALSVLVIFLPAGLIGWCVGWIIAGFSSGMREALKWSGRDE